MNEGRAAQPGRLRTYLPGGRAGQTPKTGKLRTYLLGGAVLAAALHPGRLLRRPVHRRRLQLRQLRQPVRLHRGQAESEVGDHRLGGLDPAARRAGLPEGAPGQKIKIVTYDGDANGSNSFQTKMELFNRAGSGWPDVVFTADDNSASWGSLSGTGDLAPLNKGTRTWSRPPR